MAALNVYEGVSGGVLSRMTLGAIGSAIMPNVGKEQIHSAIGPMLAKVNGGSEQDILNKLEQLG